MHHSDDGGVESCQKKNRSHNMWSVAALMLYAKRYAQVGHHSNLKPDLPIRWLQTRQYLHSCPMRYVNFGDTPRHVLLLGQIFGRAICALCNAPGVFSFKYPKSFSVRFSHSRDDLTPDGGIQLHLLFMAVTLLVGISEFKALRRPPKRLFLSPAASPPLVSWSRSQNILKSLTPSLPPAQS